MFDVGVASQTLCLAAHEAGLGTVIMGIWDEDGITDLFTYSGRSGACSHRHRIS